MMTLGKIADGKTEYLINSVAHGAEDYYVGSGEAPGVWLGGGLAGLGLTEGEEVTEEGLARVLAAQDPTTGDSLVKGRAAARTIPGFDGTFSAPKSVSTLWALAPDEETREAVRQAHDQAVREAMGYVEAELSWCRRGHGGATEVPGRGVVAAQFRHRSSRAGDPQLHSHVVIANLLQGAEDGRWGALTHTQLYALAQTGGFLYQAELRRQMTERLGVEWTKVGAEVAGVAEVEGVDADLMRAWSRRTQEIETAAKAQGLTTRAAQQQATMSTRRPKPAHATERKATAWSEDAGDYGVEPSDSEGLYDRWTREAEQMGYRVDPAATLHQAEPVQPTEEQVQAWSDHLAGGEGLTESRTTFTRREAIRAWCEAPGATTSGAGSALSSADSWLSQDEVVSLDTTRRQARYTTSDLLHCERKLVDSAESRQQAGAGIAEEEVLAQALTDRPDLSEEQRQMVESLTTSGAGVEVVVGRAGTGKTWALDAARDAWQSSGHTVIGCSLAARAAQELQDGAAIQSSTLARLLIAIRQEGGLQEGTVVVCDEAGMVGTRDLARLAQHVEAAGGKLVLVGDPRQLSEIDAGGALKHLAERLGHTELTEVHRQSDEADIAALAELRHGSVEVGMEHLGRSATVSDNAPEAHAAMVADWWAARESGASAMMMTSRRATAEDLNSVARERMREAGRLGSEAIAVEVHPERVQGKREWHPPVREFSAGDEVMFGCNPTAKWKHLKQSFAGAHNGTRATVTGLDVDAGTVTVRLVGQGEEAPEVVVPAEYLGAGHLAHGYASTIHRAQGATVDKAFVLGSDDMVRESGYVALSRHRVAAHLYVVAGEEMEEVEGPQEVQEEVDPLAQLTRSLGRSGAEAMAGQQWSRSGVARTQAVRTLATRDMRTLAGEREALEATLIPEAEPLSQADSISPSELVEAHKSAQAAQRRVAEAEAARGSVGGRDRAATEATEAAIRTAKYQAQEAVRAYREARDRGAAEASRRREGRDWLGDHTEDLSRLAELRAAEHRRQRLMGRAASALGEHPVLGQVPESPKQRRQWERVAGEVEGYRERFGQDITTEVEGEDLAREVERQRLQAMVSSLSEPPARSEQESQVEAEATRRMTA